MKEERGKAGLKPNIQKTIIAWSPINSRQIDGGNNERLHVGGSKITADGDCSHEIKRHLPFGRKVMTNLDSLLKSRDITLPTKVYLVKDMVFPVVMYGCESWTLKKAEHWRIDAFELCCWRRLLRVPWTSRRSKRKSALIIDWKGWCWSWNTIIWPPDAKNWLVGKDPDAGEDWRREEMVTTEDEMAGWLHQLNAHEFE